MTGLWPNLLGLCQVVQPCTILRLHRTGFRVGFMAMKQMRRGARARFILEIDVGRVPAR